jgi:hypothetical protein
MFRFPRFAQLRHLTERQGAIAYFTGLSGT